MFTPSRLTLARQRRGLNKKRIAELVGVSTRAVTGFESGETVPSELTVARLADVLQFPVSFFHAADLDRIEDDAVSFRSLAKMTASQRHTARAAGDLALALHDWISERFRLPPQDVPRLGPGLDAETAAQIVRAEWKLGEKPLPNVIHLLEAHGVRVFSLAQDAREVDAFSLWQSTQPFVFLNTKKSAEHSRFDAAHELGHLVMHWHHEVPQGNQPEQEANRFAAALLMPAESLLASTPRVPTLHDLIKAKRRWKVSVAALTHRLSELKWLTPWQYRMLYVEISQLGYRTNEPQPMQRETSQILNQVFTALRREGVTKTEIASALNIYQPDLDALVFGLAMLPVEGNGTPTKIPSAHPPLRLVTT